MTRQTGKKSLSPGKIILKAISYLLIALFTFVLIGALTGIIVGATFFKYCKTYLDDDFDISNYKTNLSMTTSIFVKDPSTGEFYELEDERIHGTENRTWASISQMPELLKNAFIAIEDERFYEHSGVDWKRTIGATLNFVTGSDSYGGSTITQQLIKNLTGESETTIQRKVQEIFRAISLSKKRSKDEVLELYLNTINLSRGNYGVQTAANYYFGKEVSELTLIECAALASIPKSPTKYDPVRNPEYNKERRDVVLDKMYELEMISEEQLVGAKSTELLLNITNEQIEASYTKVNSYFKDALIDQILDDLKTQYGYTHDMAVNLLYSGGLQIYSTMDVEIQEILEDVYENTLIFSSESEVNYPQSAMVVMNPYNGDVVGLVGGRGKKTESRGLNRATMSVRQIGSSIKPIAVYAPAMDLGLINFSTVMEDSPYEFNEKLNRDWPVNAPDVYDGDITIDRAVMKSKNTIAVKVLSQLSPQYSYDFLTKRLGITTLEKSDIDLAPLALGGLTNGMKVIEVTAAYSIFPNNGVYSAPRLYTKVLDSDGKEILVNNEKHTVAISESTAQAMTKLMQNVVTSGTGAAVTLKNKVETAGKTGSTNADKDRYFAGFTPYYVSAAWFGADIPVYLGSKYSGNPALKLWDKAMNQIHQKFVDRAKNGKEPLKKFDTSSIISKSFCELSGNLPGPDCTDIKTGYYAKGTEPVQICDSHQTSIIWIDEEEFSEGEGEIGADQIQLPEFDLPDISGSDDGMDIFDAIGE